MDKLPVTGNHVFINSFTEFDTLHVPGSAINEYRATAPWSEFGIIKALEPTTVTGNFINPCYIQAREGVIAIQGLKQGTLVTVISDSGTEVANVIAEEDALLTIETHIQKNKIAIIGIGANSLKVTMK